MTRLSIALATVLALGCTTTTLSPDGGATPDSGPRDAGAMGEACSDEGATRCDGIVHERCADGAWTREETCATACDDALGCVDCVPADRRTCVADEVRACTSEGSQAAPTSAPRSATRTSARSTRTRSKCARSRR